MKVIDPPAAANAARRGWWLVAVGSSVGPVIFSASVMRFPKRID